MTGKLYIVGVGPGHHDHMTYRAKQAIEQSDTIVGYETYVNLVADLIDGKEVHRYAMTQEVERAHQCIDLAKSGRTVSLVSSGDPGIYGMAGLIYETLAATKWDPKKGLPVEIIPGVSALNSCASIIGSPLMTDFAVLSMSDLLVPWEIITKRVEAAAQRRLCNGNLQSFKQKTNSSVTRHKKDYPQIQRTCNSGCNYQRCL